MTMKRHPPLLVALHWLSAFLVIVTLISGGIAPLGFHMASGALIFAIFLLRTTVKLKTHVPSSKGTQTQIARVMHMSLYGLVFAVVASGLGIAIEANLLEVFQGNAMLPADLSESPMYAAHALLTDFLLAAIMVHTAAALWHQVILRDRLFSRMWFGNKPEADFPQN